MKKTLSIIQFCFSHNNNIHWNYDCLSSSLPSSKSNITLSSKKTKYLGYNLLKTEGWKTG